VVKGASSSGPAAYSCRATSCHCAGPIGGNIASPSTGGHTGEGLSGPHQERGANARGAGSPKGQAGRQWRALRNRAETLLAIAQRVAPGNGPQGSAGSSPCTYSSPSNALSREYGALGRNRAPSRPVASWDACSAAFSLRASPNHMRLFRVPVEIGGDIAPLRRTMPLSLRSLIVHLQKLSVIGVQQTDRGMPRRIVQNRAVPKTKLWPRCCGRSTLDARHRLHSGSDPAPRNPIIGTAVFCARATTGQATAPPSPEMNSRRLSITSRQARAGSAEW
jgi:hypothetical protein